MALTPSNMLPLGTEAPDFSLPDVVSGANVSLSELDSEVATVIMFICNHCPYVIHVQEELLRVVKDYQPKGVKFAAISANDIENYPQDSPGKMKLLAEKLGFTFPYLYDESQAVARAYDAACTPDFYAFDKDRKLVYRGRLDDSTPGNDKPLTGKDLRAALDHMTRGELVGTEQFPSMGCNIKWK
ncbi:thioredoxin family protein [Fulvivirgaceae bacterium BMA12]|uniref:Thioredoxin family protein n=1 Tax=Agaribacillus aureus TaxID=3051825 RepID=A0ABT8L4Z8_9BACT|nr:thioredoxin family protein [Fulvivirgaceae bacterium BMA12]